MSTLSAAVAAEFKRILIERGLTVSSAARELGISRQAFHSYLNGAALPRHKILGKAMDLWGFKLKVGEISLDRSSFPRLERVTEKPEQLLLWDALDSIKKRDLKIEVKRVGSTLKVEVNIDIPA